MDLEALLALLSQLIGDDGNARTAEELAAISDEDMATLATELRDGYTAARAGLGADPSDEQLDALESVTAAIAVAQGQLDAREAEATRLAAEAETEAEARRTRLAALDVAAGVGDGDGTGEGGTDGGEGSGEGSGDGGEGGGGDGEGAGAGEGEGDGAGSGTQASGRPAAPAPRGRAPLASLANGGQGSGGQGSGRNQPGPDHNPAATRIVASAGAFDSVRAGDPLNLDDHAAEIAEIHASMQVDAPGTRRHTLGRIIMGESPRVVRASAFPTFNDAIDAAVANTREWQDELNAELISGRMKSLTAAALKASGGTCVIPMPDFSIRFVGQRGTAFVDRLPTVVEKRPMAFYPWFETNLASANPWADGMGTVTAAQDLAGYGDADAEGGSTIPSGGAQYKGCVHIDCPTHRNTDLSANYKCVIYGRFQAISFPEYVRVFDTSTGLWWDVYRDLWAIHQFTARTTTLGHNIALTATTFDAVRELRNALIRLLAHVRSVRKDDSLVLDVAVPSWLKYQLATGFALEMDLTGEKIRLTPDQVMALVAVEGINFLPYQVNSGPTIPATKNTVLPYPTTTIPAWPTETRLLAMVQGAVFRQSSGEASFGLTETLYQTNDYGTFMETFEDIGFRSDDMWTIDLKLCDNGTQAGTATRSC